MQGLPALVAPFSYGLGKVVHLQVAGVVLAGGRVTGLVRGAGLTSE